MFLGDFIVFSEDTLGLIPEAFDSVDMIPSP